MSQSSPVTRQEIYVALALVIAAAIWLFMPAFGQQASYHLFADSRSWCGVPNAADVLSNLGFVVVGLLGCVWLGQQQPGPAPVIRLSLNVFFVGLVLTGFGSAYYHWNPNDQTLVADRLPMTVAFAGVFGAIVGERVSHRSGLVVLLVMAVVGPASVFYWQSSADLSLYAVVQFGGIVGLVVLLALTRAGRHSLPWWTLLGWYAFSKVLETADLVIWNASRELFAGHALKHLAAAIAGLAIANALRKRRLAAPPSAAAPSQV